MTYKDIDLFISDDNMTAYIEFSNNNFSLNDILILLMKAKIVYGILDVNIKSMLEEKKINKKYLVAHGKEAKDEVWDKFEYFVCDDKNRSVIERDREGKVDFKDLNLIENVVMEQVLIQRMLTKEGEQGKDIFGNIIYPKVFKKEFPAGENTKIADYDDNLLVAAINGHVYKCDGKICVSDKYYIKGNVDYSTGNIVYLGDLYIYGDIKEGFSVQSTGSIFLEGNCDKANVICGKDFIVKKGIIGAVGKKVKVNGICKADYIENCELECKGEIKVKKYINHSHVICGDKIIIEKDPEIINMIVGGKVVVKNSIECDNIGNKFNTLTYIELGVDPFLKKKIENLKNLIEFYESKYFNLSSQLDFLIRFFNTPPEENIDDNFIIKVDKLKERKKELEKSVPVLYNKIRNEQKNLKQLEAKFEKELKNTEVKYIKVRNEIYHGVKISIKGKYLDIQDKMHKCIIKLEKDTIKIEKME